MKKTLKTVFAIFTLATITGSAFGQAVIHVAGSTAFRPSATAAILDILNSPTCAYDTGSTTYKGTAAIFYGELKSTPGHFVYIKAYWTGSMAGTFDLANQTQITQWIATPATVGGVIPGTGVTMGAATHDTTGSTPNTGTNIHGLGYSLETHACEVAMSDADQSSVAQAISTAVGGAAFQATVNNNPATDAGSVAPGTVGIVTFVWAAGHQTANGGIPPYTNITQQQAAALIKTGAIPVSELTGNGNLSDYAFLVSRNEDSGTRIDGFAEPQTGFGKSLITWEFGYSANNTSYVDTTNGGVTIQTGGSGSTLSGGVQWPKNWKLNTDPTVQWSAKGHSGYIGGGDVANNLKSVGAVTASFGGDAPPGFTNGTSKAYLIGVLSTADQAGSGSTVLTYNGVPFSVANVQLGNYSNWGFEHCYIRSNAPTLSGDSLQAANDLADEMTTTDAPTNGNGKTDNSGSTVDVAGILYDSNCKFTKSAAEGSYEIPNGN